VVAGHFAFRSFYQLYYAIRNLDDKIAGSAAAACGFGWSTKIAKKEKLI